MRAGIKLGAHRDKVVVCRADPPVDLLEHIIVRCSNGSHVLVSRDNPEGILDTVDACGNRGVVVVEDGMAHGGSSVASNTNDKFRLVVLRIRPQTEREHGPDDDGGNITRNLLYVTRL